jgi:multiple sugar transport system substrate-binding protein
VKPPTNWQEYLAFAKALNKDGRSGTVMAYGTNAAGNRIFFNLLRSNGGNVVDPDLNVVFDQPATYETLDFMKELSQYSPQGSANYAYPELINTYVADKAASTFYTGRPIQQVNAQAPQLADKIAAVPIPFNKEPFSEGDAAVTYILKDAKRKDLAKAWIKEIMYGPEWHVKWLDLLPGQNLPVRESVKNSAAYNANPLLKKYADTVKVLQEQSAKAGSFSRESPQHKLNTQGGLISTGPTLAGVVQRVLVNGETPKAAAAWGHKEFVDLMKDAVKL